MILFLSILLLAFITDVSGAGWCGDEKKMGCKEDCPRSDSGGYWQHVGYSDHFCCTPMGSCFGKRRTCRYECYSCEQTGTCNRVGYHYKGVNIQRRGHAYKGSTERFNVCCGQNQCYCQHGDVENRAGKCYHHGTSNCKKCHDGYYLQGLECFPYFCSVCANGTKGGQSTCSGHGASNCISCHDGYRLMYRKCYRNDCKCTNGYVGAQNKCLTNGSQNCKSCKSGYQLEGKICRAKRCSCDNGYLAQQILCGADGQQNCLQCKTGYFKSNKRCVKKTCANKCGNERAELPHQHPEKCSGQCNYNDDQCCEDKTCANKCKTGYALLPHQHPQQCSGQCKLNDSQCCQADTLLIKKGTKRESLEISDQFKVSFKLTPHDTNDQKSNIVYVNSKEGTWKKSNRQEDPLAALAVYFKPGSTKLQACGQCEGRYKCMESPTALQLHRTYNILVDLDYDARGPDADSFSINVDGEEVVSVACANTYQPRQGELWTSSANHPAAFADIENIKFEGRSFTGWQEPELGMSCTSHRLFVGNGISKAACQTKCEQNALCHSIFFTETGKRSCTLCSTYRPLLAVKLSEEYTDDLGNYKMMQFKRDHLSDVQWYGHPIYTCDDKNFAPGLASLTKHECETLAQTVGQNAPLPPASLETGGCMMDRDGKFKWSAVNSAFEPNVFTTWTDLLVCKGEPEEDGLVQFGYSGEGQHAWDTNPVTAISSLATVESQTEIHRIDIDLATPAQLMRVWIAQGWDDHVVLKHVVDYEGTMVNVTVFNHHDYLPCKMNHRLSTKKQWSNIVCDYAQYAEKIRIESDRSFRIAEIRVHGVHPRATLAEHISDYPWTHAIKDDYYKVDNHRGCFEGTSNAQRPDLDTIVAKYKAQQCHTSNCLATAKSACDAEWQRCWGFSLRVLPLGSYIEYYDARAVNPDECAGVFGLRAQDHWDTYRRRNMQMQDVMVTQGSNFKYNWFTGEATEGFMMFPRQRAFMEETIRRVHAIRDCTMKSTLEDQRMCYREMAFMNVVGEEMAVLFRKRKDLTKQCHDNGVTRRLGATGSTPTSEVVIVTDVDDEFTISPQRDFINKRIELMKSQQTGSAGTGGRRLERAVANIRRVEDSKFAAAPPILIPAPKPTRRRETSEECWAKAKMRNTAACENLQAASNMTVDIMKMSHAIKVEEGKIIEVEATTAAARAALDSITSIAGGAASLFAGGPGSVLGFGAGVVGGMTNAACGAADMTNLQDHAKLAKREANVILRELEAHRLQAESDRVQVCDMASTDDLKCQLGDIQELQNQGLENQANILSGMKAGFGKMGKEFKNLMRVAGENHKQVLTEFLRVTTILDEHSDTLYDITETLNVLVNNVKNLQQLIFEQHKINAISAVRDWYLAWNDNKQRFNKFDKNLVTWCSKFFDELGDPNVIDYIADFSTTGAFFQLTKPDEECTPEKFLISYNKNYNSFSALFEFAAWMSSYASGYTQVQELSNENARMRMVETYEERSKLLLDATSCTDSAIEAELESDTVLG